MLSWLFATLAAAGTIYLDADNPILVKLDGKLVKQEPATRVIAPDLPPGTYHLEVTNLFGNTLGNKDVEIADWNATVELTWADGYLDVVKAPAELVYDPRGGDPLMPLDRFRDLTRKLVKGSTKKKIKHLTAYVQGYQLTMQQTDELLSAFPLRQDRLAALTSIIDRVSQPDMYTVLDHHFAVASDRNKAHEMFEAILANDPRFQQQDDE